MQPVSYAVELTQKLIRCPSVTPAEGGALDLLEAKLADLGLPVRAYPSEMAMSVLITFMRGLALRAHILPLPAIQMLSRRGIQ